MALNSQWRDFKNILKVQGLCSPKLPCDSSLWLDGRRVGSDSFLPPVVGGLLGPPEHTPFILRLSWQSSDGGPWLALPPLESASYMWGPHESVWAQRSGEAEPV